MSLLVSVDPGLRVLGLAVFGDGELRCATLVRNPVRTARGPAAWWGMAETAQSELLTCAPWESRPLVTTYAVEVPQVYRFGKARTDPDDLIQLAGVGGAVGAVLRASTAHGYYPRQWKGQVPKDVMVARIESRLSAAEVARIKKCAPSLRHNVLDSVGIGLYHLGRL